MEIIKKTNEPNVFWKIKGIIDSGNYHEFEKEILALNYDNINVTLDFKEVPYITSAAIRVLLLCRKNLKNGELVLLNANSDVKEIIESIGFSDIVTFKNSFLEDIYHKSFKQLFREAVINDSNKVICVMNDEEYTWDDIEKCSQIIANDLEEMGVKKGTHVGICSANCINWIITFYAIQKLGAISVLVNYNYKTTEMIKMSKIGDITHLCIGVLPDVDDRDKYVKEITSEDSKIKYIYSIDNNIDYRKRYDEYEQIKNKFNEEVLADAPSVITFTSGSTGNPKGIITSSYNRIMSGLAFVEFSKATSDDIMCLYLPLFNAYAFIAIVIVSLLKNIKICICPNTKTEKIISTIEKHKCTYCISVPTFFSLMINDKTFTSEKVKTLRYTVVSGGSIAEQQMYEIKKNFPNNHIGILYAMSEIVPISMTTYDEDIIHISKTVGKPNKGVKVRIEDLETREECKVGEVGEVVVHSETAMIGYYKIDIDKQAIDSDGYIRTGDLGFIDEEGYLRITGSCKEIIKGEKDIA